MTTPFTVYHVSLSVDEDLPTMKVFNVVLVSQKDGAWITPFGYHIQVEDQKQYRLVEIDAWREYASRAQASIDRLQATLARMQKAKVHTHKLLDAYNGV